MNVRPRSGSVVWLDFFHRFRGTTDIRVESCGFHEGCYEIIDWTGRGLGMAILILSMRILIIPLRTEQRGMPRKPRIQFRPVYRHKLFGQVFSGRYKLLLVDGAGDKSATTTLHCWMRSNTKRAQSASIPKQAVGCFNHPGIFLIKSHCCTIFFPQSLRSQVFTRSWTHNFPLVRFQISALCLHIPRRRGRLFQTLLPSTESA